MSRPYAKCGRIVASLLLLVVEVQGIRLDEDEEAAAQGSAEELGDITAQQQAKIASNASWWWSPRRRSRRRRTPKPTPQPTPEPTEAPTPAIVQKSVSSKGYTAQLQAFEVEMSREVQAQMASGAGRGDTCDRDTRGTCEVFGCSDSRQARCVQNKCICPVGKCAKNGKCVKDESMDIAREQAVSEALRKSCNTKEKRDTGGTCSVWSCDASRHAYCEGGRCLCKEGTCAYHGGCVGYSTLRASKSGTFSMVGAWIGAMTGAMYARDLNDPDLVSKLASVAFDVYDFEMTIPNFRTKPTTQCDLTKTLTLAEHQVENGAHDDVEVQWGLYTIKTGTHKGKKIMGIRGTQTKKTVHQDIAFVLGTEQFKHVIQRVESHVSHWKPDYIVGHSLGGLLAEAAASRMGIAGASFNGPGPCHVFNDLRAYCGDAYENLPFDIYLSSWDPVSCIPPLPLADSAHIGRPKWFDIPVELDDLGWVHSMAAWWHSNIIPYPEQC
eukprot:TRINITY_DN16515_c0_g1_i1.p1 TRINITY_DN16515_c0_g1~~TRINITY_DN16515_c0_g1_i1.p1  ORF type:complete len:495 (-),score=50.86 TRINITY_DN16515_c0_g1_i1:87-1571(-)